MVQRHFIYTEARSGSNYLVNLFNQHPQLANYGEVLGDWTIPHKLNRLLTFNGKPNKRYLQYIFSSKLFFYLAQIYYAWKSFWQKKPINFKLYQKIKSLGVKDFHYNFWNFGLLDFFQYNQDILIINLYRENLLKQHISLELMRQTKIVSSESLNKSQNSEKISNRKIYLDTTTIIPILETAESFVQQRQNLLNKLPQDRILSISYEKLFASPESQSSFRNKVFNFLGVENINIQSDHRKIASNQLSDIIENYQEVYDVFKNTKFAQYLD